MKKSLLALFCCLSLSLTAQTRLDAPKAERHNAPENEWQDGEINQRYRAPMHSSFFAYESVDKARANRMELSDNYLNINGKWNFLWVEEAQDRPKDFHRLDYDDSQWATLPVPGIWEQYGYGDPVYVNSGYAWHGQFENNPPFVPEKGNHVGSYRREMDIPASWKGRQVLAHFGSVTSNMYLWVNGEYVGYSEDSKLEAEFDITPYIKPGQKNLLAFQVFRWCDGTYLEDQDFFRLCGVGRDCYLYARDAKKHINDIRITPDLDAQYRDGVLDICLEVTGKAKVELVLEDAAGNKVAEDALSVKPGKASSNAQKADFEHLQQQDALVRCILPVENPQKWSAEIPYLYQLYVTLQEGEKVLASLRIPVGFRKVEIKNAQVLVNGQPVLFKGVNRHEMDPDQAYYQSKERMEEDIRIMKELNINAVRTSHYPNDAYWYELCDRYGIYMVAEANVESHGLRNQMCKRPDYATAHLERNQRNVLRNYNHPAIIFWSLGNEASFGSNFIPCYQWIKAFDPSRPVQYEQAKQNEYTDVFCPMYYSYDACRTYSENDTLTKPLIQCEYAHAMGNSQGGFAEYWELIRRYPKYQGGFIWDFVDQGLRRKDYQGREYFAYGNDFNDHDPGDQNFCANGLIHPDRTWNPHAYEVQHFYQNIWVNPVENRPGEIGIYNEHFFRNLDNYRMIWSLVQNGKTLQQGCVETLEVPAQARKVYPTFQEPLPDEGDVWMNVRFELKNAEPLLPAGFCVAKQQIIYRSAEGTCFMDEYLDATAFAPARKPFKNATSLKIIKANDYLSILGQTFQVDFSQTDGWMRHWLVNDKDMFYTGKTLRADNCTYKPQEAALTANFWRAPTDNDYGPKIQLNMKPWKAPVMTMLSMDTEYLQGAVRLTVVYQVENLDAELTMIYTVSETNEIKVEEKLATYGKGKPGFFRFGMQMQLPESMDAIEYYGRGPMENYADRKACADLGIYQQSVDEQYYPYTRPQETGNKTDVRWWKQYNPKDGLGILFCAPAPLSMSALHYAIESLDDGDQKQQNHGSTVNPVPYVNLCIDKVQMGLGCVNSWSAWPRPEYRLTYRDYDFEFWMRPEPKVNQPK